MKHTREIASTWQMGTVIASGGTVTGTGADWAPTYEPHARMSVNIGAATTGTVVCDLQQSDVVGSGYVSLGSIAAGGAGTATFDYYAATSARYLRCVATCTGGTAVVAAQIIGKARTLTD